MSRKIIFFIALILTFPNLPAFAVDCSGNATLHLMFRNPRTGQLENLPDGTVITAVTSDGSESCMGAAMVLSQGKDATAVLYPILAETKAVVTDISAGDFGVLPLPIDYSVGSGQTVHLGKFILIPSARPSK